MKLMYFKATFIFLFLTVSSVVFSEDFKPIISLPDIIPYVGDDNSLHLITTGNDDYYDYIFRLNLIKNQKYNSFEDIKKLSILDVKSKINNDKYRNELGNLINDYAVRKVILFMFKLNDPGLEFEYKSKSYLCKIFKTNSETHILSEGEIQFIHKSNGSKEYFKFGGSAIVGIFEVGDLLYIATAVLSHEGRFELYVSKK